MFLAISRFKSLAEVICPVTQQFTAVGLCAITTCCMTGRVLRRPIRTWMQWQRDGHQWKDRGPTCAVNSTAIASPHRYAAAQTVRVDHSYSYIFEHFSRIFLGNMPRSRISRSYQHLPFYQILPNCSPKKIYFIIGHGWGVFFFLQKSSNLSNLKMFIQMLCWKLPFSDSK